VAPAPRASRLRPRVGGEGGDGDEGGGTMGVSPVGRPPRAAVSGERRSEPSGAPPGGVAGAPDPPGVPGSADVWPVRWALRPANRDDRDSRGDSNGGVPGLVGGPTGGVGAVIGGDGGEGGECDATGRSGGEGAVGGIREPPGARSAAGMGIGCRCGSGGGGIAAGG
jgi:hypothetical protein